MCLSLYLDLSVFTKLIKIPGRLIDFSAAITGRAEGLHEYLSVKGLHDPLFDFDSSLDVLTMLEKEKTQAGGMSQPEALEDTPDLCDIGQSSAPGRSSGWSRIYASFLSI